MGEIDDHMAELLACQLADLLDKSVEAENTAEGEFFVVKQDGGRDWIQAFTDLEEVCRDWSLVAEIFRTWYARLPE